MPTYPRSYQIVNNVKLHPQNGVKGSDTNMVAMKVSGACTIYTNIADLDKKDVRKEHPIRNANASTLRSQRHRKGSKVNNIPDLEHPSILSGFQCLQLVKRRLPMERRMLYGELGRRVSADSACFYDAIDSAASSLASPNFLRVHKPEFQFFSSPPTIYEISKKRNRGVWQSAVVGGYKVNIARYKNGLVTIKCSMTTKTIKPHEVVSPYS